MSDQRGQRGDTTPGAWPGYFPLRRAILDADPAVLDRAESSILHIVVGGQGKQKGQPYKIDRPSLAKQTRNSVKTVDRANKRLVAAGLLTIEHQGKEALGYACKASLYSVNAEAILALRPAPAQAPSAFAIKRDSILAARADHEAKRQAKKANRKA
ncbi:MAG: hypothetical protein EOO74_08465, partial [Myxococcales bacterium]